MFGWLCLCLQAWRAWDLFSLAVTANQGNSSSFLWLSKDMLEIWDQTPCLKYGIRLILLWSIDPMKRNTPPKKSIWLKSCLNKYSFTVIIWKIPYLLCNFENIFPSASENFSSTLASVFALPDLVLKLYWCNCMALVCQETAHFSMHTLGLFSSRQTSVQSRCVQTKLQMKTPPWVLLLLPSSSQNIPNSSYQ